MIFCFHFNDQLCTDFCPTVKSTSQKSARPKSALRRQKVGTVDRQDLDMTEGENLEQEFGQETASNMIDVESISSYGLDDIVNSKCGETLLCISNYANNKTPPKMKFKKVVKLTGYTYACNSLTNFDYEGNSMTGNGNQVNFLKLILENS